MHAEGDLNNIFSEAILEHTLPRDTALGCKIRCRRSTSNTHLNNYFLITQIHFFYND